MNVAVFPQEIFWSNKEHNLQTLTDLMPTLHPGTELLVLPETFSTGVLFGDKEQMRPSAERNTGATIDLLKRLAEQYNLAIAGSFVADSGGLLYNRAFFIEPSGDEYFADKKHLFHNGGEDAIYSPGNSRLKVRYRGWNIAMVVCYDVRFPVWCRNVDCEYDILLAVANWPSKRAKAWERLLTARAIENQAYVCAANCSGVDSIGLEYGGESFIFDYNGDDIGVHVPNSPAIYAHLDKNKLTHYREKFAVWRDADKFKMI